MKVKPASTAPIFRDGSDFYHAATVGELSPVQIVRGVPTKSIPLAIVEIATAEKSVGVKALQANIKHLERDIAAMYKSAQDTAEIIAELDEYLSNYNPAKSDDGSIRKLLDNIKAIISTK